MRLIDADKLPIGYTDWGCIVKAPTVDAVQVTRCKDCKFNYANQLPIDASDDVCQRCVELPIREDFYCAWGERMSNETD